MTEVRMLRRLEDNYMLHHNFLRDFVSSNGWNGFKSGQKSQ